MSRTSWGGGGGEGEQVIKLATGNSSTVFGKPEYNVEC